MAKSREFIINPYEDRSRDLSWLDAVAENGDPLDDADIPILDEPPLMAKIRTMEGGPYYVTPDSGEAVPADFYANIDEDALAEATKRANEHSADTVTSEGRAVVPADVRSLLEDGGAAAHKLLKALERGPNATNPEVERASNKRLRDAGLL